MSVASATDPQNNPEFGFLSQPEDARAALEAVREHGAASLALLSQADQARLTAACESLHFREARPVVGEGERQVHQDFAASTDFIPGNMFEALAGDLERLLHAAAETMDPNPLEPDFNLNDMIVQRYPEGSQGITPHKDHLRYRGVVCVVVFKGQGRFRLCRDRQGSEPRTIESAPGDAILMRAPGFAGMEDRLFHMLDSVSEERLAIGLRWDSRAKDGLRLGFDQRLGA